MVWPRADEPHFCHTSAVPFTFSIRHFSECCCGPRETHNYVLRHVRPSSLGPQNVAVVPAILKMREYAISPRPLLSSKSFKHVSRRLGVKSGAERRTPTGNPSPAPTHPHRTHDTTDQWRDIRLVARPILEKCLPLRASPRPTSNRPHRCYELRTTVITLVSVSPWKSYGSTC